MEIPNIFKNRTGAIQLSDLDDNFNIVKVTVNTQETQIATLQNGQATLETTLANFSAIPIGCIVMWGGSVSTIPSGWRLCDGTNGTPDLRDRFIVGAKSDSGGAATTTITGVDSKTGGFKDATLVSHVHAASSSVSNTVSVSDDIDSWTATFYASDSGLYAVSGIASNAGYNGSTFSDNVYSSTNNENRGVTLTRSRTHKHTVGVTSTVTTTVDTEGISGTNRNLPPYYALAFIMKV